MPPAGPADPARPDPEALLALAAKEGRGRLKVFLGAAPGVGKTFEMLAQARRRRLGGADIVVGVVETHGRAETQAQIADLPVLPRQRLDHRGQALDEFDLNAALARHPQILLLDELAHTNAPGSRHPKRWMDVEELRAAGIEIWTTMNVQHLESLSDPVARITGIRVAETVPDRVLTEADAVELIDIPPAELLERMHQGRIYRADQAERALRGFFREGNLAALREMALRRVAERVDADVTGYMRAHAIPGPWPAAERVMALIGPDASAETVVRSARRIADALRAPLVALHVERPQEDPGGEPDAALRLAEQLGAVVETVVARDLPATIAAYAGTNNVTHIVMGRGRPPWWRRATGRTLAAALVRQAPAFTLHLVPEPASAPVARRRRHAFALPAWAAWVAPVLLVGLATGAAMLLDGTVHEAGFGMIYLAAIVASAVGFGPVAGLAAAVLSSLTWNFLFLPPRHTLSIATAQDVVGIGVFFLVALLLAGTTGRLGRSMRSARARLVGLRRLVEFSRRLGSPGGLADLLDAIVHEAARVAEAPVCVLLPLPPARDGVAAEAVLRAAYPPEEEPDEASMAAARWALAKGVPTGRGTDTLPSAAWQFRPMKTARGTPGLLGLLLPGNRGALEMETDRTLSALLDQAAVALERLQLVEEQARSSARSETEQLRNALLTSLGHDLRTPLTAIRGSIETLRASGDALPAATRDDLLATAGEETARLTRWLNNILDLVRLENNQVTARREPTDVAEAVETAVQRAERAWARRVACEVAHPLAPVRLDPALLDQVLVNLLDNALKYAGADGAVRVTVRRDGPDVAIAVEDDGPGIGSTDLPRIFDPFFRASRSDRVAAGSGLGLAICRGLMHAMGGRIAAESPVAHGRGTRMTLRFPA